MDTTKSYFIEQANKYGILFVNFRTFLVHHEKL